MKEGVIFGLLAILPSLAWADPCEAPLPKSGTEFAGPVTYIVDGDGFCVGEAQGGIEVRLADFNAPELNTPEGRVAKKVLTSIAMGKQAECVAGNRTYDRTAARCRIDGRPVGDLMREVGIGEGGN